jgi:hypothetical protein
VKGLRYSKYNAGKKVSAQDKYMCKFSRKYRISRFRGYVGFEGMTLLHYRRSVDSTTL